MSPEELMHRLPVAVVCVANDQHYTLKFANAEGAAMLGYDPADFIDNKRYAAFSLIHPDDLAVSDRQTDLIAHTGAKVMSRYRLVAADGSLVPILDISRPALAADGAVYGLLSVIVDLRGAPELQGPSKVFEPAA